MPLEINALERLAQRCISAHEAVQAHGTPQMRVLSRMLLFEVGCEIGRLVRVEER